MEIDSQILILNVAILSISDNYLLICG